MRLGTYRYTATDNVKPDPLGNFVFTRGTTYIIPTPFPGLSSTSQSTFASVPVVIGGVPAGTNNAYVEFGYTPDFYCNENRDAACIAQSTTLNETTPYLLSGETITGVSCSSSCTIVLPVIRGRVVYQRTKFLDAGGAVIHTSATQGRVVN
jgi:hypothetical protein